MLKYYVISIAIFYTCEIIAECVIKIQLIKDKKSLIAVKSIPKKVSHYFALIFISVLPLINVIFAITVILALDNLYDKLPKEDINHDGK